METQTHNDELLECMKSLNANQKEDILKFAKRMSSQNVRKTINRKLALREIRAALK